MSPCPEGRGSITTGVRRAAPAAPRCVVSLPGRAGLNYDGASPYRSRTLSCGVSLPGRAGLNYDRASVTAPLSAFSWVSLPGRAGLNYDSLTTNPLDDFDLGLPARKGGAQLRRARRSTSRTRPRRSPCPEGRGSITTESSAPRPGTPARGLPARKGGAQLRQEPGRRR